MLDESGDVAERTEQMRVSEVINKGEVATSFSRRFPVPLNWINTGHC